MKKYVEDCVQDEMNEARAAEWSGVQATPESF